jgi:hypothetical protein
MMKFRHGQGHLYGESHDNFARKGAPKKLTVPALAHGARRVTTGALHPYLHGQTLCDEPNTPLEKSSKQVPVHPGMTSEWKAAQEHRGVDGDGSKILSSAGPGSHTSPPHGFKR